jgi:putative ABC transport system substrate-binding protein
MTLLRGAAAAWLLCSLLPLASGLATAQTQVKIWRIGACHVGLDHVPPSLDLLRSTLKDLGYVEGRNLRFDFRNLADADAAAAVNRGFVRDKVDLIVAFENDCIRAAKAATAEIPIVFLHGADPVESGFVASLARPGGNVTGVTSFIIDQGKELQLFTEMMPSLKRLLVLYDPLDPIDVKLLQDMRRAAKTLGLELVERTARNEADIERVFEQLRPQDADGLYFGGSNLRARYSSLMIRRASSRSLAVAAHHRGWVMEGALFAYAPVVRLDGRVAAPMIDRILRGAKPADLPVHQPTTFEFVINLKTAKALGLDVPPIMLMRADEVIE